MRVAFGVSWDDRKARIRDGVMAALISLALVTSALQAPARESLGKVVSVIVRELPGSGSGPETAVEALGGEVGHHIGIIRGFVAELPESRVARLAALPGVHSVTPDARVRLLHDSYDPDTEPGSMLNLNKIIGARDMWRAGYNGAGVGVALIDSGVLPVDGLTVSGKVMNGLDISFEAPAENLRHLDTYGHGTNMAGIIAGRDSTVVSGQEWSDKDSDKFNFVGVAPGAHILNIKVANAHGATDVSQVIAAIDWVVQHRNDNGMNIRVLNLSFGTDGTQDYILDPLAFAAEVAWRKGIVVVVAAGNSQFGDSKLNNPAYDPHVIAVGASDTRGTYSVQDDIVPDWSARGDGVRDPDLVAPGVGIVSLRAPSSFLDHVYPGARRGGDGTNHRFFRGSGTSQAAAAVSGAAALLIQQRPEITPDQVKALLKQTASPLPYADPVAQGAGSVNLRSAMSAPTPAAVQTWPLATGVGSLDAARGSARVTVDGVVLSGERDIHGTPWDGVTWGATSLAGVSWSGGIFNGVSWSGDSWSGVSWSGVSWSGVSWSGVSWSGVSWSGVSWSGVSWSGVSWSGVSWSGVSWSGVSWSGVSWSGVSWSGVSWS